MGITVFVFYSYTMSYHKTTHVLENVTIIKIILYYLERFWRPDVWRWRNLISQACQQVLCSLATRSFFQAYHGQKAAAIALSPISWLVAFYGRFRLPTITPSYVASVGNYKTGSFLLGQQE